MTATAQAAPTAEEAWGVIKQLSADEQERAEAEAAEKARRDVDNNIDLTLRFKILLSSIY